MGPNPRYWLTQYQLDAEEPFNVSVARDRFLEVCLKVAERS